MSRPTIINIVMAVAIVPLLLLNLMVGAADIPVSAVFEILVGYGGYDMSWRYIVIETRLPQAVTAVLCGS